MSGPRSNPPGAQREADEILVEVMRETYWWAPSKFGQFCAGIDLEMTEMMFKAAPKEQRDFRIFVQFIPFFVAADVHRQVRTNPVLKEPLRRVADDVVLAEAAAFAYSALFHDIPPETLGQFMVTEYLCDAGTQIEKMIEQNTEFRDIHELFCVRALNYGSDMERNRHVLARIIAGSEGRDQPLASAPSEGDSPLSIRIWSALDTKTAQETLEGIRNIVVKWGHMAQRTLLSERQKQRAAAVADVLTSGPRMSEPRAVSQSGAAGERTRMEEVADRAIIAAESRVKEYGDKPFVALPAVIVGTTFRCARGMVALKRNDRQFEKMLSEVATDVLIFETAAWFQAMVFSFIAMAPEDKCRKLIEPFSRAQAEVAAMLAAITAFRTEEFGERIHQYPGSIPAGATFFCQALEAGRGRTTPAPSAGLSSKRTCEPPISPADLYRKVMKPLVDPACKFMVVAAEDG